MRNYDVIMTMESKASNSDLNKQAFDDLLEKIRQHRGLDLDTYERSFLERRFQAAMLDEGVATYTDYAVALDHDMASIERLYSHLYINKTEFFRDSSLWSHLREDILPVLIQRASKTKHLRIWSAGCASGEEPYSIAMLLASMLGSSRSEWRIEVLASDANVKALEIAQSATYNKDVLYNMPSEFLKYMHSEGDNSYSVVGEIRKWVWFQQGDLLHMMMPDDLHLTFCRNVMIYFTAESQELLKKEFIRCLRPEGYLILGSAEVILEKTPKKIKQVSAEHKIYQKDPNLNTG